MSFGFVDNVEIDFVMGGKPEGPTANRFSAVGYDAGLLRPMIMEDGQKYCWIDSGKTEEKMVVNSLTGKEEKRIVPLREAIPLSRLISNGMVPATFNASALPYQAWQRIDSAVTHASRDRLPAWNDLVSANTYGGFDGMATPGIIRDSVSDPGDAKVDMDTLSNDINDSPLYTPDILPLPIIHAGFELSQRRLASSRNTGMPLDTSNAESCGRRVSETLEKMTIGVTDFSDTKIGDSSTFSNRGIYGFRTQPDRITKTDVTASGSFAAATFLANVLAMKELARAQKFYGPFVLYYSTSWDQYLDTDYVVGTSAQGYTTVDKTVRQRIEMINGISRVQMLDFFTNTDELLLVQMSSDTVRAVIGMDTTTVQWEEQGGSRMVFRVMCIKVPDLRSQYVGTTTSSRVSGIVHGTTS